MTWLLLVLLTLALGDNLRLRLRNRPRRRGAWMIDGIVLPTPDDERWEAISIYAYGVVAAYKLGEIRVGLNRDDDGYVQIGAWTSGYTRQAKRYTKTVRAAQSCRLSIERRAVAEVLAQRSIEGA